jgi:hypothetical protein
MSSYTTPGAILFRYIPGVGRVSATQCSSGTDIPITTEIFVDFLRTDSYTQTGSRATPFKTLASAYTRAATTATDSNPQIIVLLSGNTVAENVTFSKGHIFLIGENSSGTHAPIIFTGSLTFTGPNASISSNHFAVTGLELIGVSGTNVVTFSGTYPQRLFLKDVWITANGSSHGITMTNNGSGSTVHANDSKFSHNGSGHYHCIDIQAGTANLDSIETSGSTISAIGVGPGSCNLTNSDLTSAGDYVIDVYTGGTLTAANCKITQTVAGKHGISLASIGAIAVVGNITFNVPANASGRAIYGIAGTFLYYGPLFFLPDGVGGTTNRTISSAITYAVINSTPSFIA